MEDSKTPHQPLTSRQAQMSRRLEGLYPGIVEYTTDPKLLGRCRVRIPSVDGDETSSPMQSLPWAMPCFPSFMFNPPQVGDSVWVMFQGGDRKWPVYLGWFPTTPDVDQVRNRHPDMPSLVYDREVVNGDPLDNSTPRTPFDADQPFAGAEQSGSNTETYTTSANVPETPPEVLRGRSWDPNVRIWKTWRGHTIIFNDNPESEYIKIIDRAGQMLFFDCAVASTYDINNQNPRGGSIENCFENGIGEADRMVQNGRTQLDSYKMRQRPGENARARIALTDLFGQYLEFWSEIGNANIRLQSARYKDDDETPNHYLEISSDTETPDEHLILASRHGHQITIDESGNQIRIHHKSGHTTTYTSTNIIHAIENVHKHLAWLENLIMKFNNHTHLYIPGSGAPTPTAVPNTSSIFNSADGTTITEAG